ncbi:heavy-metal-associated domain-containing protein [Stieleria sp. TO1_6]|uniref:heavy-metal-associated domain-containing protein n=1 Tax=Stieleria tagensis TaxID=2956795 RepID=UPI00209B0D1B|nr:heavy metal-associated domain-containing protein [Stieleria tagensis]MCO8122391.1 heavy-metal-associated domain-containing protein [Stieleria tagensis]
MRSLAYAVAILAAAGIMYFITVSPDASSDAQPAASESVASESVASITPQTDVNTASLTLNVPEMHCPFACYPSVKKSLEQRDDVVAVELAPQKEEGVIDNRQVIVTYREGFDPQQAIASLKSDGFDGSSVATTP